MLPMQKHGFGVLALVALASTAWAGGSGWQSDLEKAIQKAAKAERPLLVEFTDKDASEKINKQVFYTAKFKSWAKKRVILVEIDYSKRVSRKLGEQYAELKTKYKIETFPTVLLLDAEGNQVGKFEFTDGMEPEKWIESADELVEAASGGGGWLTDWDKAKKLAKRSKKPMLVDFTGSDW